jgi:hypothetical protein
MNCPQCGYARLPKEARFCSECGGPVQVAARVDIRQDIEHNLGRVIGVQTEAIHGDVYGGDIYQVQVYALTDAGRVADWRRFLHANTPPYKFLSPYTAQDRALFKGRDAEIVQVIRRIGEQPLLAIYGQAGVGKTSLVAAGVIPDLIQYGALVVRIQDYIQPVEMIGNALGASAHRIPVILPNEPTLSALVRAVLEATQGSLVLIFDQFERVFSPSISDEQRAALIEGVAQALQTVGPEFLRFVFVVQEHALGRLGEWQDRLPELLRSPIQLLPLSRQHAQAAIEAPLAELNYPVSYVGDVVPEQLVPDLDELTPDTPGWIQPAQLQIVCHWLYRAARERRPPHINTDLYISEARGADGIMACYLEETLRAQFANEQVFAERVLATMASPGCEDWVLPTQLPLNGNSSEQVVAVLERLVKAELLVRRAANSHVEYAFASHCVAQEVRRLAGPEIERRYRAEDELERIWSAWLARDALATRGQLRYLAEAGAHLTPRAIKALLLLHSSVMRDEPAGLWLDQLRTGEGRALIQQLEEPATYKHAWCSSRSTLHKARLLLGLSSDDNLPHRPGNEGDEVGPVSWSAVSHPDTATRQTAALALTVLDRHTALSRLDQALRAALQGRRLWQRRAELRGALADADPKVEKMNADLSLLDRAGVWFWRGRHRLFRDRHHLAGLTLGGAIGAGLGLGLLRAVIGALAHRLVGVQFAIYFYWAAILGAALTLGMAMAESLLLHRPEEVGEVPPIWRAPLHPDRLPAVLSVGLGTLFFGLAHMIVALFNGLSITRATLVAPMGFLAGLGLSMALHAQPRVGWRPGIGRWLPRLGSAIMTFVLTQWIFIVGRDEGPGIAVAWAGSFYKAEFTRYISALWPQLAEGCPQWFDYLALLDAALVGTVLSIGITAGLLIASDWLARWRNLVDRVTD